MLLNSPSMFHILEVCFIFSIITKNSRKKTLQQSLASFLEAINMDKAK